VPSFSFLFLPEKTRISLGWQILKFALMKARMIRIDIAAAAIQTPNITMPPVSPHSAERMEQSVMFEYAMRLALCSLRYFSLSLWFLFPGF
jgi:hypothetical protein